MPVHRTEGPGQADLWFAADEPLPLLRVFYGKQPLDEALQAGGMRLTGYKALAQRFVDLFALPEKVG
jgi:hypothetical protein